jgi:hypothetical protein
MSPDELAELGADIKEHGLQSPISLLKVGDEFLLLDGRSRLDAMESVGCVLTFEKTSGVALGMKIDGLFGYLDWHEDIDPVAFVISANIHRRHLAIWQTRDLIAKLLKVDPNKSDRQIGVMTKADHKTVASVRAEKEGRGEIPHVKARTDTRGRKQPARKRRQEIPHVGSSRNVDTARPPGPTNKRTIAVPIEHTTKTVVSHGYVGPASSGEVERLHARIAELEDINRRLETRVVVLENENAKLRARLPQDDDIPPFLQRH